MWYITRTTTRLPAYLHAWEIQHHVVPHTEKMLQTAVTSLHLLLHYSNVASVMAIKMSNFSSPAPFESYPALLRSRNSEDRTGIWLYAYKCTQMGNITLYS